jgi:NTP pyrophosphatase (non-canonical NTP hydrolase)
MEIDLKEAITENLNKKTKRDAKRHVNNDKLR